LLRGGSLPGVFWKPLLLLRTAIDVCCACGEGSRRCCCERGWLEGATSRRGESDYWWAWVSRMFSNPMLQSLYGGSPNVSMFKGGGSAQMGSIVDMPDNTSSGDVSHPSKEISREAPRFSSIGREGGPGSFSWGNI